MRTNQQVGGSLDISESIVQSIAAGDPQGGKLLHDTYSRGIRYLVGRFDQRQGNAVLYEVLEEVSGYIRQGEVAPKELASCIRTVLNEKIAKQKTESERRAAAVRQPVFAARNGTPILDRSLAFAESLQSFGRELHALEPKAREVLARSYVNREAEKDICSEMKLNGSEFQFLKGLAKQKLAFAVASMKNAVRSWAPEADANAALQSIGKGHAA